MSRFTVYSDFNCPFCYALNEQLLAAGFAEQVSWRGVQHAPHLPIPMAVAGPRQKLELEQEVQAIRSRSAELPIAIPAGKPNTGPAIALVDAAMQTDSAAAHALKDSLYRAFWQGGEDISSPVVLRQLAQSAGLAERVNLDGLWSAESNSAAQQDWMQAGLGSVPAILRADGMRLVGLADAATLRAFITG